MSRTFEDIILPSNKKFGLFFSCVFFIVSVYFWYNQDLNTGFITFIISALFALVTITKADLLLPLNRLWMRFGFLLGMIVSPLVLGAIFFTLFTPIGIITRFFGRDELRLIVKKHTSHWLKRDKQNKSIIFKNQF